LAPEDIQIDTFYCCQNQGYF